jgi:hypothetical protein
MTALAWLTGSDVSHTCEKALDERGNCLLDQGSKATDSSPITCQALSLLPLGCFGNASLRCSKSTEPRPTLGRRGR